MMPTIHIGDKLELGPPISIGVNDIVTFRNGATIICHRVISIDERGLLSTKGDATDGACEVIQPGSVIGIVTGVIRNGTRMAIGQRSLMSPGLTQPAPTTYALRALLDKIVVPSIRFLSRRSFIQHLQVMLLRWIATVDVLVPVPLQLLNSYTTVATFKISRIVAPLPASNAQNPARYIIRVGSWRLAQYDPMTKSLLLRQSLQAAGLESAFRLVLGEDKPRTA